jgi:response regulator RpfG family c-di-GMP phosphodiesterase
MAENSRTEPVRILCVDDEENVLKALKRLFLDEPWEVMTALSGADGLAALRGKDVAVIISDQRMPEMGGAEFLARSREVVPDAQRIILTGYADATAAIEAINKGGAYRYVTKPWNDEELVHIIRDAVERYRLVRENGRLTELTRQQNEELKRWNTQLESMVQEQTLDIQRQNERLRASFRNSIAAFSSLIEMRDYTVSSHSKNVAALARQTAAAMALPDKDVNDVFVASLLHDIGKIAIPDAVLMKRPEELSAAERREYELHPIRGQVAMEALEGFRDVGLLIRHHHEHVDGTGFPDHLKRNAIPLGSRIIAMADIVDRSANDVRARSENDYKKSLGAVEFFLESRYDHAVYDAMRPLIQERIEAFSKQTAAREAEIHPSELVPGMIISRDIKSGTSMLLLARGSVLDSKTITSIKHYYEIDPPKCGVFVMKKR